MHQYRVIVPAVVLIYHCFVLLEAASQSVRRPTTPDLSFAESIYVKFSGACRALVDLRYSSTRGHEDVLKSMKILKLDSQVLQMFPIEEAFSSLTSNLMFDITKQTKIIIHGFMDNAQSEVPLDLARAYDEKRMFNVLMVDAEELLGKWYPLSVHHARLVGKRLGNILANLENFGANAEDFHLLGFSLGAHIAGWAGKYFRTYKGRRIGRITGMDPAGPCFTYAYSDQRLDKTDADYVDVIHTNRLVQGVIESLGHSDFYLNGGGPLQPGCFTPKCSHQRAAQAYTESVRIQKSFVGVKCDSWKHFLQGLCHNDFAVMGYGSSIKTRGLYYLRTASDPPYGFGMNGTRPEKLRMDQLNVI